MFEESKIVKPEAEPYLTTMTGEAYQPVRIYYRLGQKNAVLGRFKRLRCVDRDGENNRWAWLYGEEAKNLKFDCSYRDIPKQYRPLVLGYFTLKDETLYLDVRSFDRALAAISFFDSKIHRRLAKVTTIKVANKLFPTDLTSEEIAQHHAIFFEQRQAVNPKYNLEKVEEIAAQCETLAEREEVTLFYLEEQMKQPLPEIEELDTTFYEEGIESVAMLLRIRHIEAMEHWKGNKDFTRFDLMSALAKKIDAGDY